MGFVSTYIYDPRTATAYFYGRFGLEYENPESPENRVLVYFFESGFPVDTKTVSKQILELERGETNHIANSIGLNQDDVPWRIQEEHIPIKDHFIDPNSVNRETLMRMTLEQFLMDSLKEAQNNLHGENISKRFH